MHSDLMLRQMISPFPSPSLDSLFVLGCNLDQQHVNCQSIVIDQQGKPKS